MLNLYPYSKHNYFCDIDVSKLKFVGEGHQGRVYFLPPDKVIKIFNHKSSCQDQLYILQKGSISKFFPKVYKHDDNSIIIDFIDGLTMSEYLNHHRLIKNISFQIVELFNDFEKLGFTRIDIRLGHIFVQADETIKIIDPRRNYEIKQPYPISMLKGLKKSGVLDEFFEMIKYQYPDHYLRWKALI